MALRNKPLIIFISTVILFAAAGALYLKYRPIAEGLKMDMVKYFPFSTENSLKEWKDKIFKGKVVYEVKASDDESFVLATSNGTCSAKYYRIKLDMKKNPVISWKWNARKFPAKKGKEDLSKVKHDDFVARVYVIFPAIFFTNSQSLEYVWAESVEKGTVVDSPYSKNLKIMVLRSGKKDVEEWVSEERDIYEDYKNVFKTEPKYNIGAVAFMTDADSTKSTAEACYDDIKIGYKKVEVER